MRDEYLPSFMWRCTRPTGNCRPAFAERDVAFFLEPPRPPFTILVSLSLAACDNVLASRYVRLRLALETAAGRAMSEASARYHSMCTCQQPDTVSFACIRLRLVAVISKRGSFLVFDAFHLKKHVECRKHVQVQYSRSRTITQCMDKQDSSARQRAAAGSLSTCCQQAPLVHRWGLVHCIHHLGGRFLALWSLR